MINYIASVSADVRARIVAGLFVLGGLACQWQGLFVTSPPVLAHGQQIFTVETFAAGRPVAQTFRATANGLSEARLKFSADRPAIVTLRYWVLTWTGIQPDPWGSLYAQSATLELPAGESWQRFSFQAIPRSMKEVYSFRVQLANLRSPDAAAPPPTVNLLGSTDEALTEGNVIADLAQLVDRDLLFEAHFDDGGYAQFRRQTQLYVPRSLRRVSTQLTLLALYNLIFAVFVTALLTER